MIIAITVRTLAPSRANAAIIDGKLYQDSEGDLRGYWHAIRIVARWSPIRKNPEAWQALPGGGGRAED